MEWRKAKCLRNWSWWSQAKSIVWGRSPRETESAVRAHHLLTETPSDAAALVHPHSADNLPRGQTTIQPFFSSSICYIRTFLNLEKCCLCKKHDFLWKNCQPDTTAFSCYISAHILILQSTGFGARLPGLQLQPLGSLVMWPCTNYAACTNNSTLFIYWYAI